MSIAKYQVSSLQMALYFDPLIDADFLSIGGNLRSLLPFEMGGDALLYTIAEMPPDAPRLLLKSKNGSNEFRLSTNRCDFMFNLTSAEKTYDAAIDDLKPKMATVLRGLPDVLSKRPFRIGLVASWNIKRINGIEFFSRNFIKVDLSSAVEMALSFRSMVAINQINFNFWKRYKASSEVGTLTPNPELNILLDLNSVMVEDLLIDDKMLVGLFEESKKIFQNELGEKQWPTID